MKAKQDWMFQHTPTILAGFLANSARDQGTDPAAAAESLASRLYNLIERTTYVPQPRQY
jgi:hypothetical protein